MIWGAVLALNVIAWAAVWLKLREYNQIVLRLSKEIMETELEIPGIENIKEDILDTIQEMRPPSFVDHVGGMLQTMMQFKMQKEMQGMGMLANDNNSRPPAEESWHGAE